MWGVALVLALLGCHNPCQEICARMADYATEDCGLPVSDGEIDTCMERQSSGLEKEDLEACRDYGDAEVIRAQWSCEDLAEYWAASAPAEEDPEAR
jgi:hypothetical protein